MPIQYVEPCSVDDASDGQFAVTCAGTLAAAHVTDPDTGDPLILISMYAPWERPLPSGGGSWIYADAAAHRIISDLSVFVGRQVGHKIVAAGDLNILYGYGEEGSEYWARRYQTVFDRMRALGLRFVGPWSPNGVQASPWPTELPAESLNVPTYRTRRDDSATASRQLDFVFASEAIANRVTVSALNRSHEWGPSDHCMIQIDI